MSGRRRWWRPPGWLDRIGRSVSGQPEPMGSVRRALVQTLLGAVGSAAALALMARAQGLGALRPVNATSHWLNGDVAARDARWGWRTTGVGLLTHVAATGFWASIYEAWLRRRGGHPAAVLGKAAAIAGVAALVDYRATPKRFTPGWELVLTPGAMAVAYAAMAAGFAVGGVRPISGR